MSPTHDFKSRLVPAQLDPVGLRQRSHVEHGRLNKALMPVPLPSQLDPIDVEEFLIPGFEALDESVKTYWSDIRVPTKDGYRFMRVKLSGGDPSLLIWRDDLQNGRVRLPVAAIDQTTFEYNPDKFSHPKGWINRRFIDRAGKLLALTPRPVPYLVSYSLIVWAEHKTDAQHILFQILTRFNPLAEFRMSDNHIQGNVQLRFAGSTDASDKEVGPDVLAKTRYEFNFVAEAWLPLAERIVPTVLGTVRTIRERDTREIFDARRFIP